MVDKAGLLYPCLMSEFRALVTASHGTDSAAGSAAIAALVEEVRKLAGAQCVVLEAFVDVQKPSVDEVLLHRALKCPGDSITVVPLLLSTGYHVRQDIANAAFATNNQTGAEVNISPALGPDQRLVDVLVERLTQVGATAQDIIVLCAAGSSDSRALAEVELVQAMLAEQLTSLWQKPIKTELAFLSAAEPKLKDLVPKLKFRNPRKRVIVATYLLAPGVFADKTREAGAHLTTDPLLSSQSEPPAQLIDLILDRFTQAQSRAGHTGCLDGLANREFQGCIAGCRTSCRS